MFTSIIIIYNTFSAVCFLHCQYDINTGNYVEQTTDSFRIRSEYGFFGAGTARQFGCTSPFFNGNLIMKCMKVQIRTDGDHVYLLTTFLY